MITNILHNFGYYEKNLNSISITTELEHTDSKN